MPCSFYLYFNKPDFVDTDSAHRNRHKEKERERELSWLKGWHCSLTALLVGLVPLPLQCTSTPYLGPILPVGWKSVLFMPPPLSNYRTCLRLPSYKPTPSPVRSVTPSVRKDCGSRWFHTPQRLCPVLGCTQCSLTGSYKVKCDTKVREI